MASSTTMPMASTSPNSEMLFRLKPNGRHDGEGADDGHGHGDQRDEGRPPVLQEDQHDHGHQAHRLQQRLHDVDDRLADERRGVVGDLVVDAVREARLQLLHLGPDPVGHVQRVGAGELKDGQADGRVAVEGAGQVVVLGAQFDAGHVAEADDASGWPAAGGQRAAGHVAPLNRRCRCRCACRPHWSRGRCRCCASLVVARRAVQRCVPPLAAGACRHRPSCLAAAGACPPPSQHVVLPPDVLPLLVSAAGLVPLLVSTLGVPLLVSVPGSSRAVPSDWSWHAGPDVPMLARLLRAGRAGDCRVVSRWIAGMPALAGWARRLPLADLDDDVAELLRSS